MTDESVVSIGRMVGGLTSLTQLTLDMNSWNCLSDRSIEVMSVSLSILKFLTCLDLVIS
jgi:hypothetical protein